METFWDFGDHFGDPVGLLGLLFLSMSGVWAPKCETRSRCSGSFVFKGSGGQPGYDFGDFSDTFFKVAFERSLALF